MNPDQGTELRSGRVIHSSSETSSPIDPDMAQSSANDSDNNETSDISSQLSEIRENYEKKINELQSEFSQLKNLLMAVISKNDENNLPSTSQSSSKPAHRVGLDIHPSIFWCFATMDVKKCERIPLFGAPVPSFEFFVSLILWVFWHFHVLCYFWALDMAPTYAVPGLLQNNYD